MLIRICKPLTISAHCDFVSCPYPYPTPPLQGSLMQGNDSAECAVHAVQPAVAERGAFCGVQAMLCDHERQLVLHLAWLHTWIWCCHRQVHEFPLDIHLKG